MDCPDFEKFFKKIFFDFKLIFLKSGFFGQALFSGVAIAPGYYQFKHHAGNLNSFIRPLLHWMGGLCVVLIIYAYQRSGRLYHEEGDLVVLLVLALTTYLEGMQTGWRSIFTGLFLGLIAVCVAYFDSYIGQLIALAVVAILYSYYRQPA